MRTAVSVSLLLGSAEAFSGVAAPAAMRAAQPEMAESDVLKTLAKEQNPQIGYWDPLNVAQLDFWGQGDEATVGFLRHAEIKHGRVAMAATVGYMVQASGIRFPWAPFNAIPTGLNPAAQWDALPEAAKWQIICFVGFLEIYSEHSFILEKEGQKHYMKGGKPGYFPTFKTMVHPVPLNLFDPFGFSKNMTPEKKAERLNMEVNNGRLAQIGIMSFLAAAVVPGSVPALSNTGPFATIPYAGNIMAPFEANFHF